MTTGASSVSLGETTDLQPDNVRQGRMEQKIPPGTNEQLEPMRCPECGTRIEVRHTRYPSFACPGCNKKLCVAARYLTRLRLLTAILAFAVTYLIGFRGMPLILVGAVASLVVASIATPIGLVVLPPMIERYF
jgi:hypothetical protein